MNTTVLAHPLLLHKLSLLRSKDTSTALFRALVEEVGLVLAVEAMSNLKVETVRIDTPLEACDGWRFASADPVLVPVLRAGLGLLPPFLRLVPTAKVGHIGLARDHQTLQPRAYYRNFPPAMAARQAYILDPMLATGGSAAEAVRQVMEAGAADVTLACVLAAPEGIRHLREIHPGIRIVAGAVDRELNDRGYILPGLGDAGDRMYGTL
jgi:uracil phosphoribosyltransferase